MHGFKNRYFLSLWEDKNVNFFRFPTLCHQWVCSRPTYSKLQSIDVSDLHGSLLMRARHLTVTWCSYGHSEWISNNMNMRRNSTRKTSSTTIKLHRINQITGAILSHGPLVSPCTVGIVYRCIATPYTQSPYHVTLAYTIVSSQSVAVSAVCYTWLKNRALWCPCRLIAS